jgi:hypothetical protein
MHVRVTGVKAAAGLQTNVVGPSANSLVVQDAVVVSPATANPGGVSRHATALAGSAPSTLGVLFIIVTMCSQTASITPSVSCES